MVRPFCRFVLLVFLLLVLVAMYYRNRRPGNVLNNFLELKRSDMRFKHPNTRKEYLITEQHQKQSKAILILSYMRSGSTFTADIIQQSPDVFYMYEPFKPLQKYYFKSSKICETLTGSCRPSAWKLFRVFNDTVNIFNCNLQNVRKIIMKGLPGTAYASKHHRQFEQCMNITSDETKCINLLNEECSRSVPMIKTIRFTMDFVDRILQKIPQLKVVYLIRDPRAILESRHKGGYLAYNNFSIAAKELCTRMLEDVEKLRQVKRKFPGQFYTLYYEKLAEHPIIGLKVLYRFVGLQLSHRIHKYVHNITKGKVNNGYFSTIRADSKKVAYFWRKSLGWHHVKVVDKWCSKFYHMTGYLKIPSKSYLHNLDKPTLKPKL